MDDKNFKKLKNLDKKYEIYYDNSSYILVIGNNADIGIYNDCDKKKENYTNLGYNNSYEVPDGM